MSDHGRYLGVNDGRSRTGPIPARRPADDALGIVLSLRGAPPPTGWTRKQHEEALATVRDTLERHREESEENFQAFMDERDKAVAAEAEVARLKAVIRDEEMEARYAARAEAEVRQLREERDALLNWKRSMSASPSDGGGA